MDHRSCITVKITYKIVNDKIPDYFIDVNYFCKIRSLIQ